MDPRGTQQALGSLLPAPKPAEPHHLTGSCSSFSSLSNCMEHWQGCDNPTQLLSSKLTEISQTWLLQLSSCQDVSVLLGLNTLKCVLTVQGEPQQHSQLLPVFSLICFMAPRGTQPAGWVCGLTLPILNPGEPHCLTGAVPHSS